VQGRRANVSVEQSTVVLNLGSENEPNTVYLTFEEAQTLASGIRDDLSAGWSPGEHGINVVDAILEQDDAWELLSLVEERLERREEDRLVAGSTHNWMKEGF